MGKIFGQKRFGVYSNFGLVLVLGVLMTVGFYYWQQNSSAKNDSTIQETIPVTESTNEPQDSPLQESTDQSIKSQQIFDERLQTVINNWADGLTGESSVVVADGNGVTLAAYNANRAYFSASLYKLFVVYFGYKQIDAGTVSLDEPYVGSRTRAQCLDAMVSESDSPCAEKMWAELGKQTLTDSLKELEISDTSMTNLSTTAGDVVRIMTLLSNGEGLSDSSQTAFLASAKDQIFRDALNRGFSDSVTVYNKIGFNELKEYHDAAIVELSDGRRFVIVVLTENVGTRNIAELGRRVEAVILPSN